MSPSSSPSESLFGGIFGRGGAAAEVSDAGWLRALLDTEAALARAGAQARLFPVDVAQAITVACADAERYDVADLGRQAADAANPVVPLVRAIERLAGEAGAHVHQGATSQDILDTASMLVARRALQPLRADLRAAAEAAAELARRHGDTVMVGRTLLQQAVPTTFGLKAAGWALALHGAERRLAAVEAGLPAQLGGAAGTLAALGGAGGQVLAALAGELGLATPVLPWHTARLPIADLAGALGTGAGVTTKVALDVVLLAQTEVAEVAEGTPGRGGSSAMPHKRNPVAALSARAAARRAPALVATLLAAMEQEHERGAGTWQSEWEPLSDLLRCAGSAAAWLRDSLEHLVVNPARMWANLDATGAELAAEAVADTLNPVLGRSRAHDVVSAAVSRARAQALPLRDVLLADPAVRGRLDAAQLDALLDPAQHVGEAQRLVDLALAALAAPTPRSSP
ncbi:MAG: 3-carboxy-cis,cis-muconate cycloisomerase [Mycobacteriales bacterium]